MLLYRDLSSVKKFIFGIHSYITMATLQCILLFSLMLTFRSVQGTTCKEALKDWKQRVAKARPLLSLNRELKHEEVKDAFMPTCTEHGKYATKQCFRNLAQTNLYCWCTDGDGNLLNGTYQKGHAGLDCSKL